MVKIYQPLQLFGITSGHGWELGGGGGGDEVEWHNSWYLNFLPGNRKNDWFPARKHQENQEKSIADSWAYKEGHQDIRTSGLQDFRTSGLQDIKNWFIDVNSIECTSRYLNRNEFLCEASWTSHLANFDRTRKFPGKMPFSCRKFPGT